MPRFSGSTKARIRSQDRGDEVLGRLKGDRGFISGKAVKDLERRISI
jgi:hypothetical protein